MLVAVGKSLNMMSQLAKLLWKDHTIVWLDVQLVQQSAQPKRLLFRDATSSGKIEKEYKTFKEVRKKGKEKREKSKILADRAKIEAQLSKITSKIKFEITGQFGEKQFLLKLMNFISDKPIDIVNLKLEVPTVKGHMEKAPAFMSFEVTSTEQEDIMKFIVQLKNLIKENDMIIVSEQKT
jgi:hypothetical protein